MKFQLDFDLKTITIDEDVNLGEFVGKIKKIIPEWKEWNFKTNTVINYNSYPWYVQWQPSLGYKDEFYYTTGGSTTVYDSLDGWSGNTLPSSGTYNLQLN